MPDKYEREIEEILRNKTPDDTQTKRSFVSRRPKLKKPGFRFPQFRISFNFSLPERLLLVAAITALIAGGYAYLTGTRDIFTLVLSIIAIVCLGLVASSHFLSQSRRAGYSRYRNAPPTITITPLRRNPLQYVKTQWNLFKLRRRYRRKNGQ